LLAWIRRCQRRRRDGVTMYAQKWEVIQPAIKIALAQTMRM
jgi:hypothetical protein